LAWADKTSRVVFVVSIDVLVSLFVNLLFDYPNKYYKMKLNAEYQFVCPYFKGIKLVATASFRTGVVRE
jgi:hypothetical protein